MNEEKPLSPFEDAIQRISGTYPSSCSCDKCKGLCKTPCIGTPEDIERLLAAGYGERLAVTGWGAGVLAGLTDRMILMIAPIQESNGWCTFRRADGLCELHDKGLKPLEGRLANHRSKPPGWTIQNDFTWLIAKSWIPLQDKFQIK